MKGHQPVTFHSYQLKIEGLEFVFYILRLKLFIFVSNYVFYVYCSLNGWIGLYGNIHIFWFTSNTLEIQEVSGKIHHAEINKIMYFY